MVVNGEARGEPFYGQLAVATVVINRAEGNRTSVCYEAKRPYQFAPKKHPTKSSYVASYLAYYLYSFLPNSLKKNWYFKSGTRDKRHYGKYNMTIAHHKFYSKCKAQSPLGR